MSVNSPCSDIPPLPQPTPLAHGALFARTPIKYKEWIVEVAFRLHGPPAISAAGETGEDGQPKRLHKGGRGLAFWYTKVRPPDPPLFFYIQSTGFGFLDWPS